MVPTIAAQQVEVFAAVFALSAADVKEVPGSRVTTDVPAWSPQGQVRLPAAGTHLTVRLSSGRPLKGHLAIVFDPATHRFLWSAFYESTWDPAEDVGYIVYNWRFDRNSSLFTSPDRIRAWHGGVFQIEVWTSALTADSLDRAVDTTLSYLRSSDEGPGVMLKHMSQRFIRIEDPDPRPMPSSFPSCCSIEAIDPVDGGYRLRLRSKVYVGELVVGDDLEIKQQFRRLGEK